MGVPAATNRSLPWRRALLALPLGVITTYAVAWAIAVATDWTTIDERPAVMQNAPLPHLRTTIRERTGSRMITRYREPTGRGIPLDPSYETVSHGFPMLALEQADAGRPWNTGGIPSRVQRSLSWERGWHPSRDVLGRRIPDNVWAWGLPVRPMPLPFAINSLVYAALWFAILSVLIAAAHALVRASRRRRGLCPHCKYPTRGLDICPECGE